MITSGHPEVLGAKPKPLCPVKEPNAQDSKNRVTNILLHSGICMSQESSFRVCIYSEWNQQACLSTAAGQTGAVPACLHLAGRIPCRHPYHLPASHCLGYLLLCRLLLKNFACHLLAVRHDVRILRPDLQHHKMAVQVNFKMHSANLIAAVEESLHAVGICPHAHGDL